jgi:hypothetical protein
MVNPCSLVILQDPNEEEETCSDVGVVTQVGEHPEQIHSRTEELRHELQSVVVLLVGYR